MSICSDICLKRIKLKEKKNKIILKKSNQLHAVSRTLQGRQRAPKTLRFPLYAELWRHCMLNDGTQRRAI